MGRALGWLAVLASCSPQMGEDAPWIPVDQITGALAPELGDPPAPRAPGDALRVLTFNILEDGDLDLEIDQLVAAGYDDLDVLLVQELESYPDEPGSRASRLAAALGMGYVYAPAFAKGDGTHGLAILSHHALTGARVMQLPEAGAYPIPRNRIALAAELDTIDGPLTVICIQLDTRLSLAERVLQLRPAILDAADPVIIGGDMNTLSFAWAGASIPDLPADVAADTDQGPALDDYVRALGFDTPTADVGATWHGAGLRYRLDAIYTRGVTPGAAEVDREIDGSDHWPVRIDVSW